MRVLLLKYHSDKLTINYRSRRALHDDSSCKNTSSHSFANPSKNCSRIRCLPLYSDNHTSYSYSYTDMLLFVKKRQDTFSHLLPVSIGRNNRVLSAFDGHHPRLRYALLYLGSPVIGDDLVICTLDRHQASITLHVIICYRICPHMYHKNLYQRLVWPDACLRKTVVCCL